MAKRQRTERNEYHKQFSNSVIKALEKGTAPWQKPWQPGERVLPHNFSTGRDYRGGNAVLHPVMQALDRGLHGPALGRLPRQIAQAGGHVRKGERGTRIMYVESQRRVTVRDDQCQPDRAADGRP